MPGRLDARVAFVEAPRAASVAEDSAGAVVAAHSVAVDSAAVAAAHSIAADSAAVVAADSMVAEGAAARSLSELSSDTSNSIETTHVALDP
jgi:hypothetical protein